MKEECREEGGRESKGRVWRSLRGSKRMRGIEMLWKVLSLDAAEDGWAHK